MFSKKWKNGIFQLEQSSSVYVNASQVQTEWIWNWNYLDFLPFDLKCGLMDTTHNLN